MRWGLAILFFAVGVISVAAFIDACDTTGTAHDRAIIGSSIAAGSMALVLLWGRLRGGAWLPLIAAFVVGGATLGVMESLQFGACLS